LICLDLLQVFQARGGPIAALQKPLMTTDKIVRAGKAQEMPA
jgi:hypothetical protein